MANESTQKKLSRVRKPRVHITYEVETEGASIVKELPFVVGVLGDFSGNPTTPKEALSKRKFVQIDRDNFNDVMAKVAPELHMKVANTMTGDGELAVDLEFKAMDDFEPGAIVQQVEPLRRLKETRDKLNDLMSKVDRSEDLEAMLEEVLTRTENMDKLRGELGLDAASEGNGTGSDGGSTDE